MQLRTLKHASILIITVPLIMITSIEICHNSDHTAVIAPNFAVAGSTSQKFLSHKSSTLKSTLSRIITNTEYENIETSDLDLKGKNSQTKEIQVRDGSYKREKDKPILIRPEFNNTWRKNAVQLTEIASGPRIAIVIDDAGLDLKRTAAAINLIAPITISFLTYSKGLREQVRLARKAGHEILVHVAMEPINKLIDPGPNALMTDNLKGATLKKLRWGLERFDGYVGINNHMGSRFTADPAGMEIVMKELKRRGLLFLDSRTSEKTVSASIALAHDVPFTERNIFLDNINSISAINKQLHHLEKFANKKGYAVAIAHPRDATIEALSQWLAVIAERGFVQVPISTIVAEQRGLSGKNLGDLKF